MRETNNDDLGRLLSRKFGILYHFELKKKSFSLYQNIFCPKYTYANFGRQQTKKIQNKANITKKIIFLVLTFIISFPIHKS